MRWLSSAEELDAWAVSVVATVSVASYSAGDTPAATEFNQVFNKARWLVVRIFFASLKQDALNELRNN